MTCPKCGSENTVCVDSRNRKKIRRRRYSCQDCGGRFTTYEVYAEEFRDVQDAMQRLLDGCRGMRKK